MKKRVAVIIGTRPDIIKQWSPYINLKKKDSLETLLIHSGQHSEMGVKALETFNLIPDHTLRVLEEDKYHLGYLVSRLINEFTVAFYAHNPDLVLVHGDTSTAFSAAVAAFLQNRKVGHVEAGLRTSRFEYPFPEEGYRRAISRFTNFHFAPTAKSAQNLRAEGINSGIYVTGNTVIDSLNHMLKTGGTAHSQNILEGLVANSKFILVTCHRRESYGKPLLDFCYTLKHIAISNPDVKIVWPVHSNTKIRNTVIANIGNIEQIHLEEPVEYNTFVHLLSAANLVISDSGGVMEEAAVLGKPTLILRDETERPECLDLDCVKLVGYNFLYLFDSVLKWLEKPPIVKRNNIFGDGTAGEEIADIICQTI